ncbi:MAG: LysM peptidoglycan-binding domain-containing protein [Alphaproteobacteria bacterium]|nr:LysM peptidoglycan-binding domain-containing protein [Alphaproteobacteria bacterium]
MFRNHVDAVLQAGNLAQAATLIDQYAPIVVKHRIHMATNVLRYGSPHAPGKYSVQPGDTFGGIAAQLGVSADDLLHGNPHISSPSRLSVGQELNVPSPAPSVFSNGNIPVPVDKPLAPSASASGGGVFASISNLFGGLFSGGDATMGYTSIIPSHSRTSNLNLESLLGAEISRSADSIVDRIVGRNPNMFQTSAGRFLSQSVERFGEALTKGRIDNFEDAFTSVLGGKNGAIGFASNIGNQVVGGLLQSGLDKLFGSTKTSTTSYESARSIAAGNAFGMSRGQQAAEMLMQLQKGQRNL